MIKFIATDMDGTLLSHGVHSPSEEAFHLISRLQKHGVLFAAASGRQYPNLRRTFSPICESLLYICENGNYVRHGEQILKQSVMENALCRELEADITSFEGCESFVSCPTTYYCNPKDPRFIQTAFYDFRMTIAYAQSVANVAEPVLKMSLYQEGGINPEIEAELCRRWQDRLTISVSGSAWLDFTMADKGEAIELVQQQYGILPEEMVAFGDNFNDITMLERVGHSYAMAKAPDAVKNSAKFVCHRVEDELRRILEEIETAKLSYSYESC